jgi:CubicO group peptidase (beta-lactamase class C family)
MEETFRAGVQSHTIPGVVLLATSRDGKFQYSNAFGNLTIADANSAPISADSPMWIASCTKLLTTIAALQCVERGLLALDADVSPILPEFHAPDILTGFDAGGQPTYVKAQNKVTLRQLLTHSSGLAYDLFNPTIQKWRASQGQPIAPGTTVRERYLGPLLYEPGTGWEYSPAIDFVGLMVERVSGARNLQAYMEREIWSPLGIAEMTFFPQGWIDLKARMPVMSIRDEASGKAVLRPRVVQEPTDAMGGGGIYATPAEYMKVLHAVLKNDGTLLKRETVEDMFQPQLSGHSRAALLKVMSSTEENAMNAGLPEGTKCDWGLGGLLVMQDLEGWRSKGTMTWGGMPNLTWWIDREADICGLYASQILPPDDPKSVEMSVLFEKTMYERYRRERASL